MANKLKIGRKKLLVLLEFEDSEYGKIIYCLDENDEEVFVINNKIITDEETIGVINKKYNLKLPDEMQKIIF